MGVVGVFAAHNLEEIAHLPQDLETLPAWIKKAGPWRDVRSFTVATSLLTAAVGAGFGAGHGAARRPRALLLHPLTEHSRSPTDPSCGEYDGAARDSRLSCARAIPDPQ
ncbi:hypothetical protein MANAM107_12760 [Actinomyces capricornis]|uniref:Uncharacterized protein n=1 Tax=Actinomyces capricornis TaxID=2755559 RepID=A0ABM7UAV8_9ACTO|nr:hypothetical protein MANAM107_12760 [Actinomyces capricornis]